MAKIDSLIEQIENEGLRSELERAAAELREQKKFGLVFEQHIPETSLVPSAGLRTGSVVMIRTEPDNRTRYIVESLTKHEASIIAQDEEWIIPREDLLVVKPFGEPVYPVLQLEDQVTRSDDRPYHTVIIGENFHALQLLLFSYRGKFDCIYIDPPYNTGARDWKYNNAYVDDNDTWHHSKWLSMMEKRLRLARKLLKPNGVLVVTIDEHEMGNLSVLLAEKTLFAEARRQMVTIVTNAAGVTQGGFYRVEEYAFFCFLGDSRPLSVSDDLLSDEDKTDRTPLWFSMIRFGGINALPSRRPGLVYPIGIDPKSNRIVATGRTLKDSPNCYSANQMPTTASTSRIRPTPDEVDDLESDGVIVSG